MLAYALKAPEMNVVLLNNMASFGLEQGGSPLNADYFGCRRDGRLEAVGALYNLRARAVSRAERLRRQSLGAKGLLQDRLRDSGEVADRRDARSPD